MNRSIAIPILLLSFFYECVTFGQEHSVRNDSEPLALAVPFTPSMVLQRDQNVPVWGTARPGENVSVTFAHQTQKTVADTQGKWRVQLDPLSAGGPFILTVQGKDRKLVLDQVLVGDVWICSGQSNMAFVLKDAMDAPAETEPLSNIRLLRIEARGSPTPATTAKVRGWFPCTPQNAAHFSAVGYYFGKYLDAKINVPGSPKIPIGLIDNSWGGATCEAYIESSRLKADATLNYLFDKKRLDSLPVQKRAAFLYNGMIHPILPFAIKGVIWYQGEANAVNGRGPEYAKLFPMLIQNWRDKWQQGDFPFYFVQLPDFREPQKTPNDRSEWAILRQSQASGLSLPRTEQAITLGLGDPKDIHPRNKKDVSIRLARIALALDYGVSGEYTGPRPSAMNVQGNIVTLDFVHVGSGLVSQGNSLKGFSVAGSDGVFHWADATIQKNRVILTAKAVVHPVTVRYAWADNPVGNLSNREGFPAGTFEIRESQP